MNFLDQGLHTDRQADRQTDKHTHDCKHYHAALAGDNDVIKQYDMIAVMCVAFDVGVGVRRGRRCPALRAVNRCSGRGPSKDLVDASHLRRDLHT